MAVRGIAPGTQGRVPAQVTMEELNSALRRKAEEDIG
jgi:hypothetical protein